MKKMRNKPFGDIDMCKACAPKGTTPADPRR